MDLSNIPLFAMLTRRMAWLNRRQEVLAENVANADTPDYRPRDLKPLDFAEMARAHAARLDLWTTQAGHIANVARPTAPFAVQEDARHGSSAGGETALEDQLMKVAETGMAYQLVTSLYRKHVDMIKAALGRAVR